MAYRKTYIVRSLPKEKPPKVTDKNFNSVSDSLYRNKRGRDNNPLPDSFYHCQLWLAYFYQRAFKNIGEFCPINTDHFMVRYYSKPDSLKAETKLFKIIAENKGLKISASEGG